MEQKVTPELVWQAMSDLQILFSRFLVQQGWEMASTGRWTHPGWPGGPLNTPDAIMYERRLFEQAQRTAK